MCRHVYQGIIESFVFPRFLFFLCFTRYVEGRFPQLLMHCTKVTGALLTDERIFKEYLVPFRRPQPPATNATGTTSSGAPAAQPGTPGAAATATAAAATATAAERSVGRPEATAQAGAPEENGATAAGGDAGASAAGGGVASGGAMPGASSKSDESKGGSAQQTVEGSEGRRPSSRPSEAASASAGGGAGGAGAVAYTAAAFASPGKRSATTTPRSGRKSYNPGSTEGGGGENAKAPVVRVTEQNGPRGEAALKDVLVWNESGMAKSMGCR